MAFRLRIRSLVTACKNLWIERGTFVTKPKFSRNIKRLQSFSEMCEQMGVVPGAHMLENKIVDADEKIAARLGIETGSKVIFISRLRFADSEPVVIEKTIFR